QRARAEEAHGPRIARCGRSRRRTGARSPFVRPAIRPVLRISGTPGSSTISQAHARDAEQRGIRLFSYDRPGYGGSTRQKGRAVADCAADVTAVCDDLGVDRLRVWGISGGGPHALAAAALLPERVAAVA